MNKEKKRQIFNIRTFEPKKAKANCTWLLIGKRRSGKSVLLFDLLHHTAPKYDISFSMAETTDSFRRLQQITPFDKCYPKYSEKMVANVIRGMRNWYEKEESTPKKAVLIQDDCMFNKGIMKSETQRQIYMNSRNFGITSFATAQYLVDLPTNIRANIDYVCVMKEPILDNRKKLYKYFFGVFPSFQTFNTTLMQLTANYGAVILDNSGSECSVEKTVFKYRADPKLLPRTRGDPQDGFVPRPLGKKIHFEQGEKIRRRQEQLKKSQKVNKKIEQVICDP